MQQTSDETIATHWIVNSLSSIMQLCAPDNSDETNATQNLITE